MTLEECNVLYVWPWDAVCLVYGGLGSGGFGAALFNSRTGFIEDVSIPKIYLRKMYF